MTGGGPVIPEFTPVFKWIIWSAVWLLCGGLYIIFFYQLYHPNNGLSGQYSGPVGQYYSYVVLIMLNVLFGGLIFFLFMNPMLEAFTYTMNEKIENFGVHETFVKTLSNIIQSDNGNLLRMFVGIFMLGYFTEFITLIIVLVVFRYGFQNNLTPNNNDNHEMVPHGLDTLHHYNDFLVSIRVVLFVMLFMFVYHYLNPTTSTTQNIIRNMLLITCSLIIVICGIYQYYYSVHFLQVKLKGEMLFIGVPTN